MAYELLFRDSERNAAVFSDPDAACADTLVGSIADIGLDHLVGDARGFVNVSEGVLMGPHLEALPRERVTLEILETVRPTPAVIARIRELASIGFEIALDDFVLTPENEPLIEVANIVKLDVLNMTPVQLERARARLAGRGVRLLAEKVETQEVYAAMRALGFDLFQGYFFCKATVVRGRRLSAARTRTLELLSMLQDPEVDLRKVASAIRVDVPLTFRLLRYANTSVFGRTRAVNSVEVAVSQLGLGALRSMVSLLALSSGAEPPPEVMEVVLLRARMCELVAARRRLSSATAFTVGLFSRLDLLLGISMEELASELPSLADVNAALLRREGALGGLLAEVEAYERAVAERESPDPELVRAHVEALRWAHDASGALAA